MTTPSGVSTKKPASRVAVLVLGMHRSGTSAITRIISLLGAVLPEQVMNPIPGNNETGFWESQDVYQLNEALLAGLGSAWDDWSALAPDALEAAYFGELGTRAHQVLERNFGEAGLFVLKDPRICRLMPFWARALKEFGVEAKYVLPFRNPIEVALSLQRRDAFHPDKSYLVWLRHTLEAEYFTRGCPRAFLAYEDLISDWRGLLPQLERSLGLQWPKNLAAAGADIDVFLRKDLRHYEYSESDVLARVEISAWVRDTYATLCKTRNADDPERCLAPLDALKAVFDHACAAFSKAMHHDTEVRRELQSSVKRLADVEQALKKRLGEREDSLFQAADKYKALEKKFIQVQGGEQILKLRVSERDLKIAQLSQTQKQLEQKLERLRGDEQILKTRVSERDAVIENNSIELNQIKKISSLQRARNAQAASERMALLAAMSPNPRGLQRFASAPTGMSEQALLDLHISETRRLPPRKCLGHALSWKQRRALRVHGQLLLNSGLFDPLWYLEVNFDVALSRCNPVWHWQLAGWKERRQPHPLFDTDWYLAQNPDVADATIDPLLHFVQHGLDEQRRSSPLFDNAWYTESYTDVRRAGIAPLRHYLQHGLTEGRDPNPYFDYRWYLAQNPDVPFSRALHHYLEIGAFEGRDPSPRFDSDWYLTQYPEVAAARVNPLLHYLKFGAKERRLPKAPAAARPSASDLPAGGNKRNVPTANGSRSAATTRPAKDLLPTSEDIEQARIAVAERPGTAFSIVLPTWNRAKTIARAIDSVLEQSYEHWELLICDDGSEDGTEELVRQRYAALIDQQKIRYLALPHGGVCAARNAGLAAAKEQWIAYLDSDNAWLPHYLLITAAGYATASERRTAYAGLHVTDEADDKVFVRCRPFDWPSLRDQNFIDLNIFSHHRDVYQQLGGFDESLRRLVDWDLILRYTRIYEPKFNEFILANYFLSKSLGNITHNEPLEANESAVRRKFATASRPADSTSLRLAYVIWDWPALSQTFVLEEIRELLRRGIDVRVYYVTAPDLPSENVPPVRSDQVTDAESLAKALVRDRCNWIHSHFVYPTVTQLVWPAAEETGIAFSFMPHAVDIFHHANRERNRIGEIAKSSLCARVMVHGEHHRNFLISQGVPPDKFILTPQAADVESLRGAAGPMRQRTADEPLRILSIGRFIEKKGIQDLIAAVALCRPQSVNVRIYGYGPLEDDFKSLIAQHGLESTVQLCGTFEGSEALRSAMQWADVFCLPCIEASNGDIDGMPTVLFEAMAAGLPCVAGAVSAIPDFIRDGVNGFLTPPADIPALATLIQTIGAMPVKTLQALASEASRWVFENVGTHHTVDTLLDVCMQPPIDIFMVTYHKDGYGQWEATRRAIQSVLDHTSTPFLLSIVDNGSDAEFLDRLAVMARGDSRIRLLPMNANLLCGPASNIALALAQSEYVFYICSNEGYVARTGWERACLRHMRNRPEAAMGGRLVSSPSWHDGEGYRKQPWFAKFRNPEFAETKSRRDFYHVQGGLYVLQRQAFVAAGGFSERLPQAQTDVEYCYYLESLGYQLTDIDSLFILSNKTRPNLEAFVDESVVAAHPVFDETVALIDRCANEDLGRCNLCGWHGTAQRHADRVGFDCPDCQSTPRDRAIFRWLAAGNLHHRGLTLDRRGLGDALCGQLKSMFHLQDGPSMITPGRHVPGQASRVLGIPPSFVDDGELPEHLADAGAQAQHRLVAAAAADSVGA